MLSQQVQEGVDRQHGHLASVLCSPHRTHNTYGDIWKVCGRMRGLEERRQVPFCPFIFLGSLPTACALALSGRIAFSKPCASYFGSSVSWTCRANYSTGFIGSDTANIWEQPALYGSIWQCCGWLVAPLSPAYHRGSPHTTPNCPQALANIQKGQHI